MNEIYSNEGSKTKDSKDSKDLNDVANFNWKKVFKVFLFRIPLGVVLVFVIAIASLYTYSKITREKPVNLRPAIINATNVEITISTCNKQIDKQGFNIRDEEQKIEKKLKETEGVENASVLIERDQKNCKE